MGQDRLGFCFPMCLLLLKDFFPLAQLFVKELAHHGKSKCLISLFFALWQSVKPVLDTPGSAGISRQELLAGVLTVLWRDLSLKIEREVKLRFPGLHRWELAGGENSREAGLQRNDCLPNRLDILPACGTHGRNERQLIYHGGALHCED